MAPIYVINGFYMSMREKYTKPGASIHYFLVEWDSDKLSWGDFRSRVLGATDPPTAEAKSLRREIFDRYQELGLKSQPNVGDNGVHASASPFEALAERINWVGVDLADDAFGKQLLSLGIPKETILAWTKDPQVDYDGKKASLFDSLEDTDADECIKRALKIAGIDKVALPYKTNSAFVFVKPHAVNQTIVSLVEQKLIESGIAIKGHGSIDHAIIESKQLIDNHYYAIANKASLTKPKDLNPPASKQEEFAKQFGLTWADALARGLVYNAVDACSVLGIDGENMDRIWAKAKKAGLLVKFGGGFYCGQVEASSESPPKSSGKPVVDTPVSSNSSYTLLSKIVVAASVVGIAGVIISKIIKKN
eukprot:NODE_3371_length_1363_cov_77.375806_g2935_i0.p1 GENE.NODE_3371_length_1363_cov_77.375806_g2935_i0~~NODE_3371_length_1363_cov_77.375806_g2935_i0.p1  ORF type:complete len:363 (+),score=77.64 NODE_3371_length_1363_cov_77.375806_g2935_i0:71-1159(+)